MSYFINLEYFTSIRHHLRIIIIVAGGASCNNIRGANCNSMLPLFSPHQRN